MSKRWNNKDKHVIQNYYFTGGSKECHKRLPHRTLTAIKLQAQKLGIKGQRGPKINDLTGKSYGTYVVMKRGSDSVSSKGAHQPRWKIKCIKCGAIKLVQSGNLKNRKFISCPKCPKLEIGKRYNKWLEPIEKVEDYIKPTTGCHYQQFLVKCYCRARGCKEEFIVRADSILCGHTKSCGCLNKETIREIGLKNTKENNPNWKGGITELSNLIRGCTRNSNWKDFCRERDNYTCQKCEVKSYVEVHHCKIPFCIMLEELIETGITDVKDIPDDSELWDVDNGSTLCTKCHKESHRVFKNGCTKEEFEEWLNQIIDNTKDSN